MTSVPFSSRISSPWIFAGPQARRNLPSGEKTRMPRGRVGGDVNVARLVNHDAAMAGTCGWPPGVFSKKFGAMENSDRPRWRGWTGAR